jgi:CDP-diacylglycerol--glycerol-3-phosphate 3-phosphatidyltransferase
LNLPNSITLARISCVPLFLWILSSAGLHASHGQQELLAAVVFLLASATHGVDGYLARHTHQVTTLGTLLSALSGQLLVSTAYIALVRFAPELVPAWLAVLIVGREFMVTGLRAVAVQEHMTLAVRDVGKGKSVLQVISVLAVLAAHRCPRWQVGGAVLPGTAIAVGALWLMLAVSLLSAFAYFRAFWLVAMQQSQTRSAPVPFAAERKSDRDRNA